MRMAPISPELLDRSSELKSDLIEFVTSPRHKRLFRSAVGTASGGTIVDESQLATALESLIFEHRFATGESMLDRFAATRRDLSDTDRSMLAGWSDSVFGVFEVIENAGDSLTLLNLLDDLTYQVCSNAGEEVLAEFREGFYVLTRIVPMANMWMLSGMQRFWGSDQREGVSQAVCRLAAAWPWRVLRNPDSRARTEELLVSERESFLAFFGADLVVVAGADAQSRYDEFQRFHHDRRLPSMPAQAPHEHAAPDRAPLPAQVTAASTVAFDHDDRLGLGLYADYEQFAAPFADPDLAGAMPYVGVVRGYLHDDSVPAGLIRRIAQADPDKASDVFATVLRRPRFSWKSDGEVLLRERKSAQFRKEEFPQRCAAPAIVREFTGGHEFLL